MLQFNFKQLPGRAGNSKVTRGLLALVFFALLTAIAWISPVLALPPGFQEYFVLGNEFQLYHMIASITSDVPPLDGNQRYMASIVDVTITTDNQVIFYDHWEDGYEEDILNPTQTGFVTGTLIFGDGDPANGHAGDYTGRATDILKAGDSLPLSSRIPITATQALTGYVPINPRQTNAIRFDGADRIVSTVGPIGLVHNVWPIDFSATSPDQTWAGDAWEIYSVQALENAVSYRTPVGVDMGAVDRQFKNVDLQIEALFDNTTVQINNGVTNKNVVINRGETYSSQGFINNLDVSATSQISITANTQIQSDKPVQVGLVTYQNQNGVGFQDRYFNMIPEQLWGKDYVMPVAHNGAPSEVYIFNANPFTITVQAVDTENISTFNLPPGSTIDYTSATGNGVPTLSGVRLSSPNTFWAIATADTNSVVYDWGNTFIPQIFLTDEYYASWSPGNVLLPPKQSSCNTAGNLPGNFPCRNGSPLWVTAVEDDTTVFVDYDNDDQIDETFILDALEVKLLRDETDFNQSGTHVWTEGREKLALIWGEDSAEAGNSVPNLDIGHLILPLSQNWLINVLNFEKTASPQTLPLEGGTVDYYLTARAANFATVNDIVITDTLPYSWTYLSDSSLITFTGGSTITLEPSVETSNNIQTLFWNLNATLATTESLTLRYQAAITTQGSIGSHLADDFENNSYNGGTTGWLSDWQDSQNDGPFSGNIQIVDDTNLAPYGGQRHLQLANDQYSIERAIDLSQYNRPVLRFKRAFRSLETNETFGLDIFDGNSYVPLLSWTSPLSQNVWFQQEVDLSNYITSTARIRFRGISGVGSTDYFHLDEIEVYDRLAVNTNVAQLRGNYLGYDYTATDKTNVYISPLHLIKRANTNVIPLGETLVYTITYQNISPVSTVEDVIIGDSLDPSLNFVSASNGGQYISATHSVSWTVGNILTDTWGSLILTATVDTTNLPENGDIIVNTARLRNDRFHLNSNSVSAMVQAPDLNVLRSAPATAHPGQVITYSTWYQNNGALSATNIVFTDSLSADVAFVAGSCGSCNYISQTHQVVWSINSVSPGQVDSFAFQATVSTTVSAGALILSTGQYDYTFLNNPRNANIVATVVNPILLRKEAGSTMIAPGQALSFTLLYSNVTSAFTPTNLFITDEIPADTTYIANSASSEPGVITVSYSIDGGQNYNPVEPIPASAVTHLGWTHAQLPPQTAESVTFQVRVRPVYTFSPGASIQNIAWLQSDEVSLLASNLINVPLFLPTTTLTISKEAADIDGPPLYLGDTIHYTVRITNTGVYTAINVSVNDALPPELQFAGANASQGQIDEKSGLITWTVSTLPLNSPASLIISATVKSEGEGESITNTASVVALNGPQSPLTTPPVCPDGSAPNPGGWCEATPEPVPPPTATLSLSKGAKDVNGPPLLEGDIILYTLNLTNTSPYTAFDVTVIDDLPEQVSFENSASTQGASSETNGQVMWTIPALSPFNPQAQLLITVTVNPQSEGQFITNTAYVSGSNVVSPPPPPPVCPNGQPANPNGSCQSTPVPTTTLKIAKTAQDINGPPLYEGEMIAYTVRLSNTGAYTALTITVQDNLPPQLIFEDAFASQGLINENLGHITWTVSALAVASEASLTINATVNVGTVGQSITNTAQAWAENVPTSPLSTSPICPDGAPPNNEGLCDVTPQAPDGPLVCAKDIYEVDDTPNESQWLDLIATEVVSQSHAFHLPTDQDWLRFEIHPGAVYTFATRNLARLADTQLSLYDGDASTLLAFNDDVGHNNQASLIEWTAPVTPLNQTVYLKVSQTPYNAHSCRTDYDLHLNQTIGGNLDSGHTRKTVHAYGPLKVGSIVTYTIKVHNQDTRWTAPLTVSDQLPISITLQTVSVCGTGVVAPLPTGSLHLLRNISAQPSDLFSAYNLTLEDNAFIWSGAIGPWVRLDLCAVGIISSQPWTATNTAWMSWNGQTISRSVTAIEVYLPPVSEYELYLPLVMK